MPKTADETEPKTAPSETMRIPRVLYIQMRTAIRLAARDSRRDDRVLHDASRDALTVASDAMEDFQDARVKG